ncbi:hypothetical protein AVEN_74967-1 [Araneus ventricosus]|uniref:Uncharacterized protein n=1 Tax=Araneus ventricosus TaxID=182803 RepID=A0A4Y2MDC4_ARAVE|nr:hypothetical protein AVEN_74967-1 [Araneus ventricosus]
MWLMDRMAVQVPNYIWCTNGLSTQVISISGVALSLSSDGSPRSAYKDLAIHLRGRGARQINQDESYRNSVLHGTYIPRGFTNIYSWRVAF